VSLRKEILKNRKGDFRSKVLKSRKKKQSERRDIEKRSNEDVVRLHPSAQHTWPQLYACSSIFCPFHISSHPQLGQENQELMGKL
jgi:hypothetical protein